MKVLFSLFVALLICATPAFANWKSYDLSKIPKGTKVKYLSHLGNIEITHLGPKSDGFAYKLTRDNSENAAITVRSWSDAAGNTIRAKVNGETTIISPHDCSMTFGICEYSEKRGQKPVKRYISNATLKADRRVFEIHEIVEGKKVLYRAGWVKIDEFGYTIERADKFYFNGDVVNGWLRRK
ncbi:MAG: hypothetical protein AAF429_14885 [Pseudomonadota bacterium]